MVQKEKEKSSLDNISEYNELRKMNDFVFKTMFNEVVDTHLNSFYTDALEPEFDSSTDKFKRLKKDIEIVKGSLVKLNSTNQEKMEELLRLVEENEKSNLKELEVLKYDLEYTSTKLLQEIKNKEQVHGQGLELVTSIQNQTNESVNALKSEFESKILEVSNRVNEAENLQKSLINKFVETHNQSIEDLSNNLLKGNKSLDESINTGNKKLSSKTQASLEELDINFNNKISAIQENIKNNFEIIQKEDGLTQLTNYKKENDLQISSLKSAIVWLMGINIVLAISILAVLIIVLF